MTPLFRIAARNVVLHWRRSLATLLALSSGALALLLFRGYVDGVQDLFRNGFVTAQMLGDVVIEKKDASNVSIAELEKRTLNEQDQSWVEEFLKASPEVEVRVRALELSGMITNGRSSTVFLATGYDVEEGARLRGEGAWNATAGKPLHLTGADSFVIGGHLGKLLECAPETPANYVNAKGYFIAEERPFKCLTNHVQLSATTFSGQANAIDGEITGLTEIPVLDFDSKYVSMPLAAAQTLADSHAIHRYALRLRDPEQTGVFIRRFNDAAQAAGRQVEAFSWRKHRFSIAYNEIITWLSAVTFFITSVFLGMSGMAVLNTVLKNVQERSREVGSLRSMGFIAREIVGMFCIEAGLLGLLGAVLGTAFAAVLGYTITKSGYEYELGGFASPIPLRIEFSWSGGFLTSLLFAAIAFAAAIFPAYRSMKKSIPECLGENS